MKIITPFATDGTPVMMGKKRGYLKVLKDDNPEMLP
jgi:hypothetical protein